MSTSAGVQKKQNSEFHSLLHQHPNKNMIFESLWLQHKNQLWHVTEGSQNEVVRTE